MPGGLRNQPKVFRGAFVEYGLNIPPLVVIFQFNPEQLSRSRSLYFSMSAKGSEEGNLTLRDFHQNAEFVDLSKLRHEQQVSVNAETLSFDIRLDATDKLNEGDADTESFGITPQLATLERLLEPKSDGLGGAVLDLFVGGGFSFTGAKKPPMTLFVWGPQRILPVNIDNMQITESEFNANLEPIRATVAVSLTVIEGPNMAYLHTHNVRDRLSRLHLANLAGNAIVDVKDIFIPR